jgi:hypothetical protein
MSVEDAVLEKVKKLPAEKKQEVLDFAEFLFQKDVGKKARRSLKGALSNMNIKVSLEDVREARREMWRGYMKEDFE